MDAVDTNVLIYAHDPRDPVKQNQAVELIASLIDGALASCRLVPDSGRPAM